MPGIYRRFADVVGNKHWTRRVSQINAAIKSSPLAGTRLRDENAIAFALQRCGELIDAHGRLRGDDPATRELYPAVSFAAQVLWMMDMATAAEAGRLRKRVEDTLKNPDAMRGFRLELGVATHFARRGLTLHWPEMVGGGTFDLCIPQLDLEVECKSISNDKGRSVHKHEVLGLQKLLVPELVALQEGLRTGIAVVLTVPRRLPTREVDRRALAQLIKEQILIGKGARLADGTDIRINEFDLAELGDVAKERRVDSAVIEKITGTRNREAVLAGRSGGGALCLVVQSAVDDAFVEATFDTLRDAAKRQLSRTRPGILVAGFDDLAPAQLLSIAEQDNDPDQPATALVRPISDFLSAPHRNHVVGVAFLSRSELLPSGAGFVDSGGTAYYFPNRTSPRWREDFSGLFTPRRAGD
jgi:hypothetical protein